MCLTTTSTMGTLSKIHDSNDIPSFIDAVNDSAYLSDELKEFCTDYARLTFLARNVIREDMSFNRQVQTIGDKIFDTLFRPCHLTVKTYATESEVRELVRVVNEYVSPMITAMMEGYIPDEFDKGLYVCMSVRFTEASNGADVQLRKVRPLTMELTYMSVFANVSYIYEFWVHISNYNRTKLNVYTPNPGRELCRIATTSGVVSWRYAPNGTGLPENVLTLDERYMSFFIGPKRKNLKQFELDHKCNLIAALLPETTTLLVVIVILRYSTSHYSSLDICDHIREYITRTSCDYHMQETHYDGGM